MGFYFITYKQQGLKNEFNGVINKHPLDYIHDFFKEFTKDIVITFYEEITEEQYIKNRDDM